MADVCCFEVDQLLISFKLTLQLIKKFVQNSYAGQTELFEAVFLEPARHALHLVLAVHEGAGDTKKLPVRLQSHLARLLNPVCAHPLESATTIGEQVV